jgi:hypothetical protein
MSLNESPVDAAALAMPKAALTRPLPRGEEREIGYAVGHGAAFAGLRRAKHSLVSSEPAAERVTLSGKVVAARMINPANKEYESPRSLWRNQADHNDRRHYIRGN